MGKVTPLRDRKTARRLVVLSDDIDAYVLGAIKDGADPKEVVAVLMNRAGELLSHLGSSEDLRKFYQEVFVKKTTGSEF